MDVYVDYEITPASNCDSRSLDCFHLPLLAFLAGADANLGSFVAGGCPLRCLRNEPRFLGGGKKINVVMSPAWAGYLKSAKKFAVNYTG